MRIQQHSMCVVFYQFPLPSKKLSGQNRTPAVMGAIEWYAYGVALGMGSAQKLSCFWVFFADISLLLCTFSSIVCV